MNLHELNTRGRSHTALPAAMASFDQEILPSATLLLGGIACASVLTPEGSTCDFNPERMRFAPPLVQPLLIARPSLRPGASRGEPSARACVRACVRERDTA